MCFSCYNLQTNEHCPECGSTYNHRTGLVRDLISDTEIHNFICDLMDLDNNATYKYIDSHEEDDRALGIEIYWHNFRSYRSIVDEERMCYLAG